MTYKSHSQVHTSFDEKFLMDFTNVSEGGEDNWRDWNQVPEPQLVKDFITKTRTEDIVAIEEMVKEEMNYYYKERTVQLNKDRMMVAYDMDSRYVAMKHLLSSLEALRKTL